MAENAEWEAKVKGLLKAELKKRGVTYAQLVDKLAAIGVVESEPNIRNKRDGTLLDYSALVS